MFVTRILASFFALGAISAVATPAPVIEKRQDLSDVSSIVSTLQSATGGILPQIDSLVNAGQATQANLAPLLAELVGALGTSTTALQALSGLVNENAGGSQSEIAAAISGVYTAIATTSSNIKTKAPSLYFLVSSVNLDSVLEELLLVVNLVVPAIFTLVAGLLTSILGLLSSLGFTLLFLLLLLL